RVSPQDLLIFGDRGVIDNTLRFENECVRHKVLDLVGDLMLSGCDVIGKISAYRAGHRMHAQLVQSLISNIQMISPWKCSA
ncbi:MAG: UDP-3-O-acyl-N-acetylglucosamine deacetylase, partial [Chloroflexi bacterium]|nr:UDP-3-O-acyl-N-acetylglucosamine deacetylase [Chloroflexota bacterium]